MTLDRTFSRNTLIFRDPAASRAMYSMDPTDKKPAACGCKGGSCSCNMNKENPVTQPAVYIQDLNDVFLQSLSGGGIQKYVLTQARFFGLGLNLAECSAVLRIKSPDSGFGITIKVEYSPDGQTWTAGASAVITEKTTAGDYVGVHSTAAEILPFYRLIAEVRDTGGSAQKQAQVKVWQYMKYRV